MTAYSDRVFRGDSTYPDHEEWYYRAREGVVGPYSRREDALIALEHFIRYCQLNAVTGGRVPVSYKRVQPERTVVETLCWAARHLPRALYMKAIRH
jgi:hypothetical protein